MPNGDSLTLILHLCQRSVTALTGCDTEYVVVLRKKKVCVIAEKRFVLLLGRNRRFHFPVQLSVYEHQR